MPIPIELDGKAVEVPEEGTVDKALQSLGYPISKFPGDPGLFMPCQTGGCWSCALNIDGRLAPACITTVHGEMRIKTDSESLTPRRLAGGFMAHRVGGVGTPWWLAKDGYLEAACFAAGCNFLCPQCQNWQFSFLCSGDPLTPEEAARKMTATRRRYGVDRMAISGGECTLNRRWLVQYLGHLKEMNPDASLHVDTNGSILTRDYLDELVWAGMTDIGIDLKALRLDTFMEITGLEDKVLANRYLMTAWDAVKHLIDNCSQVFLGVGIPYNSRLISLEEVGEMGRRIAGIDPLMQVCVLDYRPEFQRLDIARPAFEEMVQVHEILRATGLKSVICQTAKGRIGPSGELLP